MSLKVEDLVPPFINAIECVEKILSCAICLETSSEPIETRCGHLFCNICIQQILSRPGESCPLCKLVLTRRNVMSGSQMELCVRKLSNLIDAIRTDTDIDMRVCLKMHHEKRSAILFSNDSNKPTKTLRQVTQFDKEFSRDSHELNSPKNQNLTKACPMKMLNNRIISNAKGYQADDPGQDKSYVGGKFNKARKSNKNVSKEESSINIEVAERSCNNCEAIDTTQQFESSQEEIETVTPVTTCKTVKLVTSAVNEKRNDNFVSETTTIDKNLSDAARTERMVEIANKGDKQFLFNENRQVSNNLLQNSIRKLGRSGSPKTICAVGSSANTDFDAKCLERMQTNEIERTVPSGTIVRFKKLGHLCKGNKKSVTFLYFGATKRRNSNSFSEANSDAICHVSSSSQLTKEIRNEFLSMHRAGEINQRIGSHKIDSYVENTFISRVRMISPQSYSEFPHLAAKSGEERFPMSLPVFPAFREMGKTSSEKAQASVQCVERLGLENCKLILSPKIKRKRKRSESPSKNAKIPIDLESQLTDQRLKKKMGGYEVSTETANQTDQGDYAMDLAMPLQMLQSQAIEKRQITEPELNTSKESNVTDKLSEPISSNAGNSHKNHDYTRTGVLVDHGYSSSPTTIAQTSRHDERHEVNEIISSQNSMMNITDEEVLLKKFEIDLFGPKNLEKIPASGRSKSREDVIDVCKENTQDSSQIIQSTLSHDQQKRSTKVIPRTVDSEQLSRNADVVDSIVTTPACGNVDNDVKPILHEDMFSTISDIQSVVDRHREYDAETPSTSARGKSKFTERRMRTGASRYAKLQPIYQSTPKSSHQNLIDRLPSHTNRPSQVEPSPFMTICPKTELITNSQMLESTIGDHLVIICSGLSSKQIDKVKRFSTSFGAKYSHHFRDDITHVIVKTDDNSNAAYKTLKYLQGIAWRKWVLNYNWILDCMAQRKIVGEEAYEVVDNTTMLPGPRRARLGDPGPFEKFTIFCVPPFVNMSVTDCEDLLRRTGARVVQSFDELAAEKSLHKVFVVQAGCHENKIIDWHQQTKAVGVDPSWIVECISQYRIVSFFPFLQELLPQDVLDLGFPAQMVKDDDMDFMYEI